MCYDVSSHKFKYPANRYFAFSPSLASFLHFYSYFHFEGKEKWSQKTGNGEKGYADQKLEEKIRNKWFERLISLLACHIIYPIILVSQKIKSINKPSSVTICSTFYRFCELLGRSLLLALSHQHLQKNYSNKKSLFFSSLQLLFENFFCIVEIREVIAEQLKFTLFCHHRKWMSTSLILKYS